MRKTNALPAAALFVALLSFNPPGAASAQNLADYDYENLSFRGVGVDIGRIWPNKVDEATQTAIRLDMGFLGPAIRIVPTLAYWRSQLKASELERLARQLSDLPALRSQNAVITAADLGSVDWSSFSLSVDAQAVWTAPLRIFTYVGLGVGMYSMNGKGTAIDDTFIEDLLDAAAAGVSVMAGLEYEPAPRLRLYAEARYTMQSDIRYPGTHLGAALMRVPGGARSP